VSSSCNDDLDDEYGLVNRNKFEDIYGMEYSYY